MTSIEAGFKTVESVLEGLTNSPTQVDYMGTRIVVSVGDRGACRRDKNEAEEELHRGCGRSRCTLHLAYVRSEIEKIWYAIHGATPKLN